MRWSDEMVFTATRMWGEGRSAAAIVEALNCGVTRNAVIGKMHRLGVPVQRGKRQTVDIGEPLKATAGWAKRRREAPGEVLPQEPMATPAAAPKVRTDLPATSEMPWAHGVGILAATAMHCRAVRDERGSDGLAVFCGDPVHVRPDRSATSWCIHHLRQFVDPDFLRQALTGRPERSVRRAA